MTTRRLFVLLFLIALYTMAVRPTLDPDMWWHLRTGQAIATNGIPKQDLFSFTVSDHPWTTHEWLSEVIMWGAYQVGGLPGLMVFFPLIILLTFGLVYLATDGRPFLAAFVTLLAAITSAIVWDARPQMFNLLFTAAFVVIVEQYKKGQIRRRALWLLPFLTVIWVNLHSGYLFGIVVLGAYIVGDGLQRWLRPQVDTLDWPSLKWLAGITAVSFLAAALNPSGIALWTYPFTTLTSPSMQIYIQEWHSPDFHAKIFWPFIAVMGLGAIGWMYSQKRPSLSHLFLFAGPAFMGLLSARNIPLFAITAVPFLARGLLSASEGTPLYPVLSGQAASAPPSSFMKQANGILAVVALLTAVLWTSTKIASNDSAIAERFPVAAVDYLQAHGMAQQRGYNSYNWGGYLIWRGLPVFVDGRADVYGDDFLFYYRKTFDPQSDWQKPLDDYQVQYILLERDSPPTTVLIASGQWQEIYHDDLAAIFTPIP